jgi:hypothetical protein
MENGERSGFRKLVKPLRAHTLDGQETHLKAGSWVRWISASRDQRGDLTWRFEDRAGNVYRITGPLSRTTTEPERT